jgi:hypothetical protein
VSRPRRRCMRYGRLQLPSRYSTDGLGQALIFMPGNPEIASQFTDEQQALEAQLQRVKKAALTKTIISGVLLPVTEVLFVLSTHHAYQLD